MKPEGSGERISVLCVDDEPEVLEGLKLQLRRGFTVETATGGEAALRKIEEHGSFAVVISDMRMPGMDGASFLARVRERTPDSVRILLTGHSDLTAAIAAVNEGQIFRFLTKPCPPASFLRVVIEAAELYRLREMEKTLLERTLKGSVQALSEVLALVNPIAFGRATRLRRIAAGICDRMALTERWPIELAALLSQIGYVTLPEATATKVYFGRELDPEEQALVSRLPAIGSQILSNIPRLEPVLAILRRETTGLPNSTVNLGVTILDIAAELDAFETAGMEPKFALARIREKHPHARPVLDALERLLETDRLDTGPLAIPIREVRPGMVFAEDVRTRAGLVLVARGFTASEAFIDRMQGFRSDLVVEPVLVWEQKRSAEAA